MANALKDDLSDLEDFLDADPKSGSADFLTRFVRIKEILESKLSNDFRLYDEAIERLKNSEQSTEPDMLIDILDRYVATETLILGGLKTKTSEMISSARKNGASRSDVAKLVNYRTEMLELYSRLLDSFDAARWELMALRAKLDPSEPVGPVLGDPFDSDAYADSLK